MSAASVPAELGAVSCWPWKWTRSSGLREGCEVEGVRRGTGSGAGGVGGTHALCPHHGAECVSGPFRPGINSSVYWLFWCKDGTAWRNSVARAGGGEGTGSSVATLGMWCPGCPRSGLSMMVTKRKRNRPLVRPLVRSVFKLGINIHELHCRLWRSSGKTCVRWDGRR